MPTAKSHIVAKLNDINVSNSNKSKLAVKQPFVGLFQKSPLNANKDTGKTNQAAKTVVDAINKQVQGFPVIIF